MVLEPEQHGDQHDHDRAANELGEGELPADERALPTPTLNFSSRTARY